MNRLQKSLRLNALFSGISGIILIVLNKQLATLFETPNNTVFIIVGIILLYFACSIIYEIIKQRLVAVLWIIVQDFLWVAGSIVLVIFNPFEISKAGNSTIAIIAFIVLFMGINQTKALAQVDRSNNIKKKQFRFERIIKANKQSVWKVISDVANYDKVAPNIDAVKIISGEGRGMVRSCSHGKNSWTETCSMWIEEKAYSFEVNTLAPDYPYPFKFLNGTWEVQEIDSTTTRIVMLFEFQYKRNFQNWLIHPLLKGKFTKVANELLDNWQNNLETNHI
jgi:ribosome-associated toxin RatA of RatAB toxin-antitoxin module